MDSRNPFNVGWGSIYLGIVDQRIALEPMSIQCLLLQILTPSRFAKPSSGFTFYLPFLFSPSLAA
ncbi:MAG: hypothetical protein WB774_24740, partial [Xanthobacteraceae bacterium]